MRARLWSLSRLSLRPAPNRDERQRSRQPLSLPCHARCLMLVFFRFVTWLPLIFSFVFLKLPHD